MMIAKDRRQVSLYAFSSFSLSQMGVLFFHTLVLLSGDFQEGERTNHSIFAIEFYQRFFNVDANIVYERIMSAIVPRRAPVQYVKQDIGPNPDLYGPFWIVVTLVNVLNVSHSELDDSNCVFLCCRFFQLQSAATSPVICQRRMRISIGDTISILFRSLQRQLYCM